MSCYIWKRDYRKQKKPSPRITFPVLLKAEIKLKSLPTGRQHSSVRHCFQLVHSILLPSSVPRSAETTPYPQRWQELIFARLFPFTIHHQTITGRHWSSRRWPRCTRSLHGSRSQPVVLRTASSEPTSCVARIHKSISLPGIFIDLATKPAWWLLAGDQHAPWLRCGGRLCHNLANLFGFCLRMLYPPFSALSACFASTSKEQRVWFWVFFCQRQPLPD